MIRRPDWKLQRGANVLLVVALAGTFYLSGEQHETAARGEQAHVKICALRDELARRNDASRRFLREHPGGAFGFAAAEIQQSIDERARTIGLLSPGCPDPPNPEKEN